MELKKIKKIVEKNNGYFEMKSIKKGKNDFYKFIMKKRERYNKIVDKIHKSIKNEYMRNPYFKREECYLLLNNSDFKCIVLSNFSNEDLLNGYYPVEYLKEIKTFMGIKVKLTNDVEDPELVKRCDDG